MSSRNNVLVLIVGITVLVASCTSESANSQDTGVSSDSSADEASLDPETQDNCLDTSVGERCWEIAAPDSEEELPLLLDLHAVGVGPADQREISGFEAISQEGDLIVVWPQGTDDSWNAGDPCCKPASANGVDDVAFLKRVIETVSDNYPVDSNRVYVSGLSNGCAMAQRLANEASEEITAVACMAHFLVSEPSDSYEPVPVMELHGTADNVVKYSGAEDNQAKWAGLNNCEAEVTKSSPIEGVEINLNENCDNNSQVALASIAEGEHGLYEGLDTEIDTTTIAWDFLRQFSK